jgi:hypothetical protein
MGIFDSLMPGEESGMPTGILNQSGWRGALEGNNAMMNIGLGILANNSGNYGSAMAALGKGAQQGVQNTQTSRQAQMQQAMYKMKLEEAKKALEQQQKQQEWLKTYGQPNATQETTTQAPDTWQNAMQGQAQPNFNMERVAGQQTTTQTPIFDQNKALLSGVQNGAIDFKDYLSMQQEQAQKEQNARLMEAVLGNQSGQPNNGGLDRNTLNRLGVAQSLSGGKGGDAIMKYAETMKQNWQNVGGKLVDANQFNGEIPVNPTPMSEAEKARGAYEGWLPPQAKAPAIPPQSQKTQPQPDGYKYNPSISPKANNDLAVKYEGAKIDAAFKKDKPLPATVLKMQNEALDKLSIASNIDKDLGVIEQQVIDGKLNLGLIANAKSEIRNKSGYSDENSRNYATFKNTLERLRNDSLRLNTGVQTDGDAQRAWNELFANITDNEFVKKRLGEIRVINQRGADLQKLQVDQIRSNFDADPLDFTKYEGQKPAIAGDGAIMPNNEKIPTNQQKSVITKIGGKSVSLKLGNDGLYYDAQGNGYRKPK